MGFRKPKKNFTPGMELAGVIESIGKNVTTFKKGDAVFGSTGMSMGSNAEYKCLSAKSSITIKPDNISFEEAATIPVGGINAMHFLKKANIKPGQNVLVNGAGGSIGTYGVQLAKHYGAEVQAVDSAEKLDMLHDIGADHVLDYTKEDFAKNGVKYDVIFDMVYKNPYSRCIHALTDNGIYLMANPGPRRMLWSLWTGWTTKKKVIFEFAAEKIEDMNHLAELIGSGKIKSVIDRCYPLEQIEQAHSYVEKGHKKGTVVINIEPHS
jgi:NADPH:quinone reductase-like Zn-dependent oxidoreductase